jgi:putative transposase
VITDKLRSSFKPIKTLAPDADHRAHKGLNNAIEGSHRPTRKREKIFGRFKSHRQAQRFLSAHDQINLIFRPRRFQLTANSYRHARADAFSLWAEYTIEMVAQFTDQKHPTTRCQQLGNAHQGTTRRTGIHP